MHSEYTQNTDNKKIITININPIINKPFDQNES